MPFVYIVRCADGRPYVGHTNDLPARLRKHNEGTGSLFTANRRPVSLVYVEEYGTSVAAVARERQIKRWTRRKKEALIARDGRLLKAL